jgi:hypothetical protein
LQKNWLTSELVREIEAFFPTKEEISNTAEGDNVRDLEAFMVKAAKMLPKSRILASLKQVDQVSKMFLDAEPCNKNSRLHDNPSKCRKIETSVKNVYKCPFKVRYSFINYCHNKDSKKPNIFYPVKITKVNYQHTCQLSTVFHQESKQKNGTLQLDLNGLNHIIGLLREKPSLKSDLL